MMTSKIVRFFAAATLAAGFSTAAHAQATRTWVSGTGSDANPCSRTAPCQTWAGAFVKTATNGEISALDPGGFGAVTLSKSITLNGDGTLASILNAGTTGIIVNITTNLTTDKVVIRNISIQGAGTGTDGVRIIDGQEVILDNVTIIGFTDAGVDVTQSQSGNVFLRNVRISKGAVGVRTQTTAGAVNGTFENVAIDGMTSHGMECVNNTTLALRNVETSRCGGSGVRSAAASVNLAVENSVSSGNNFGYEAVLGNLRIANSGMFFNNTNCTSSVLSAGNNRSAGNTITNNPTPGGMTIH
ncbi:MAG TPA: right-handed parallel beta-helix repeat-containing protein [Chthoniobacterales bacterium]|nr:right-handed parallel beta-helix repeat-containing protein [Chthoniobacterales bacterium]